MNLSDRPRLERVVLVPPVAIRRLGFSRRQLEYWAKTGLVVPALRTPGGHARYSGDEIAALEVVRVLLDGEVSLQRIRRVLPGLMQLLNGRVFHVEANPT